MNAAERLEKCKGDLMAAFERILDPDFDPKAPEILDIQREGNLFAAAQSPASSIA